MVTSTKRVILWSLVATLAVFFVLPAAGLGGAFLPYKLLYNTGPPEIGVGLITDSNWHDRQAISDRFTDILYRRFPVGTNASVVRAALGRQGFKPLSPPPADCLRPGQPTPIHRVFVPCYDPTNRLEYRWSMGLACGGTLSVAWTTDSAGGIASLKGGYYSACL